MDQTKLPKYTYFNDYEYLRTLVRHQLYAKASLEKFKAMVESADKKVKEYQAGFEVPSQGWASIEEYIKKEHECEIYNYEQEKKLKEIEAREARQCFNGN